MKMRLKVAVLAATLAILHMAFTQPKQEWVARYNGPENGQDLANAIAVDNAGNVYVTGASLETDTTYDYATIKYSSTGVQQWATRYNGSGNGTDDAKAIAVDNAGNVYVTGTSQGSGTGKDFATVKYDLAGNQQWVARYNGPGNGWDETSAIVVDARGNVYITGVACVDTGTAFDYATIKYNSSGTQQWAVRYNGPGNDFDEAKGIAVDDSGSVCVTGISVGSSTSMDYATVKYSPAGVQQWVARYDGPSGDWDGAYAIAVDKAGCVYVTGTSQGVGTYEDYATVKYSPGGVEQWVARYNGPGVITDGAAAIAIGNSGDVYVTGVTGSMSWDCSTVKYDSAGIQQWAVCYNGPGNWNDQAEAIAVDDSGNVYVAGVSEGSGTGCDYMTIKYNAAGDQQWVVRYNGPGNSFDGALDMAVDGSGNIYVTGWSVGLGTDVDYATVKYGQKPLDVEDDEGRVTGGRNPEDLDLAALQNPSHGPVTVRYTLPAGQSGVLSILDAAGRVVRSYILSASSARSPHSLLLTPHCPPGVFFLRLSSVGRTVTVKVVKVE